MPAIDMKVFVPFDVKVAEVEEATTSYICREVEGLTWDALDAKIKEEERDQGRPELGLNTTMVVDDTPEKSVHKFILLSMFRVP